MCGIWLYLKKSRNEHSPASLYRTFSHLKHRGPDSHVYEDLGDVVIGFHRLAIMDPTVCGEQPFSYIEDGEKVILMCNGEIYNHKELIKYFDLDVQSKSDCEVLPLLYKKFGNLESILPHLEGSEFAIIVVRINQKSIRIEYARDPAGTRPIYYGEDQHGFILSSELKGCMTEFDGGIVDGEIHQVDPRKVFSLTFDMKSRELFHYKPKTYWETPVEYTITDWDSSVRAVRASLIEAVKCRLESDRGLVFLNSGGIDSSIICAIAQSLCKEPVQTLCVGLEGGTDLKYAQIGANFIGSNHISVVVKSEEEFLDIHKNIPKIVESWDTTTVRASTVQFKAGLGVRSHTTARAVVVGEGADELFGGYIYFHNCPESEFGKETVRLFEQIHLYDGARADRCLSFNSLECRTPFLDSRFVRTVLSIDPKLRMVKDGVEKKLLREAFKDMLPREIIERPKEAQSDGCSSVERSWYQIIKDSVGDEDEYCRKQFIDAFGEERLSAVKAKWLPRFCGDVTDPSARVLKHYK